MSKVLPLRRPQAEAHPKPSQEAELKPREASSARPLERRPTGNSTPRKHAQWTGPYPHMARALEVSL